MKSVQSQKAGAAKKTYGTIKKMDRIRNKSGYNVGLFYY